MTTEDTKEYSEFLAARRPILWIWTQYDLILATMPMSSWICRVHRQ